MPRYRRRRTVEAMSDHIEEDDDATQNQDVDAVDADEDEDEQPRSSRRTQSRVARERSFAARGAPRDTPVPERDGPDDAQGAAAVFDEDAFGNKPLSRHDGQRLHGMASDWNMIRTNLKESAFSLLTEVSTAVAEYADEGTAEKVILFGLFPPCVCWNLTRIQELDRLDGFMRELIDIDTEIRSHEQTLKDLHQQVVTGEEIVSGLMHFRSVDMLSLVRVIYWSVINCKFGKSWTSTTRKLVGKSMRRARRMLHSSSQSMLVMIPSVRHSRS